MRKIFFLLLLTFSFSIVASAQPPQRKKVKTPPKVKLDDLKNPFDTSKKVTLKQPAQNPPRIRRDSIEDKINKKPIRATGGKR
jgi:hypothetical protein